MSYPPSPTQPLEYRSAGPGACPKCGSGPCEAVKFTWWGGVLGPKLLHHTKCKSCGFTFNSKTGKPNGTAIAIYLIVAAVIGIALGLAIALIR